VEHEVRKYYHILRARLSGWHYVLRNPRISLRGADDFNAKTTRTLLYRLGHSKYWDEVATRQPCGCIGYKGHLTSYVMDCPEHGLDALFPKVEE